MKKTILITLLFASLSLLGRSTAEATYIYDWVTTGVNTGDCGTSLKASWEITDQEFSNGVFSSLVPGDLVSATVEIVSQQYGTFFHTIHLWPTPTGVTGVLNIVNDKKTILSLHDWESGRDSAFLYDLVSDLALNFTATSVRGNIYGIDVSQAWDRTGYWELREPDAAVPEPATVALLALGLGALLWRGRQYRKS